MGSETWHGADPSAYEDGAKSRYEEQPDHYLEFPGFESLIGSARAELLDKYPLLVAHVLVQYVRQVGAPKSARIAIHHLANDVLSLFEEVARYDGRAAARSARAIFESAVNVADVVANPELARRYMAHESVVMVQVGEYQLGVDILDGDDASPERRRLEDSLKEHTQLRQAAVDEFGKRFEKEWHPTNLRERCRLLGWEDRYRGYQILSALMHGSAGGLMGNRRATVRDTILRLGRSLELLPVALLESVKAVSDLFEHAAKHWPDFDPKAADAVLGATSDVLREWPAIRRALLDLDDSLWPEVGAPDPVAVLAVYPGGSRRWYWHDPLHEIIAVAEPPADQQLIEHREQIENFLAHLPDDATGYNGRPVTVALFGVRVMPKRGAVFAPAGSILSPRDAPGHEALDEPRLLEFE